MNIPPEITILSDAELLQLLEFVSFEQGVAYTLNLFLTANPPLSFVGLEQLPNGAAKREFVHRVLLPQPGGFTIDQTDLLSHWYLEVSGCEAEIAAHNASSGIQIAPIAHQGEMLAPAFLLTDQHNYLNLFPVLETCPLLYREIPIQPFE